MPFPAGGVSLKSVTQAITVIHHLSLFPHCNPLPLQSQKGHQLHSAAKNASSHLSRKVVNFSSSCKPKNISSMGLCLVLCLFHMKTKWV